RSLGLDPQRPHADDRHDERQRRELPGDFGAATVHAVPLVLRRPGLDPARARVRPAAAHCARPCAVVAAATHHGMSRLSAWIAAAMTVLVLALAIAAGSGSAAQSARSAATTNLVGTFKLKPGHFAAGKATGTYFRMILHGGGYFTNPDSSASDKTYTLGTPGSDGSLITGRYQAPAGASFDSKRT